MSADCIHEPRRSGKSVKANVLVIEDDRDTADTIGQYLCNEGYAVRITFNREDAVPAMDGNIYHFIIMDLFMTGMAASDFVKRVSKASPLSKLILITAAPIVSDEAKKLGVTSYLGKPFKLEQLSDILDSICP